MFTWATLAMKEGYHIAFIWSALAFLGFAELQFYVLLCLMVVDTIAWAIYAFRYTEYTSRKAWDGVMKKCAVLMAILSVALLSKGMGWSSELFAWWLLGIAMIAETVSILKNIIGIKTWRKIEEADIITASLESLINVLSQKTKQAAIQQVQAMKNETESRKSPE